jgi:leader peptidase (prepilin peptidase)/N-methyltransferase
MTAFFLPGLIFSLIIGIIIGSFLNVCIYRIPKKIKVYDGFSVCPVCNTRLRPADLVPVVSYFILKRKCRYCKCRISPIYPVVELLTGLLFAAAFIFYGICLNTLIIWVLSSVLTVASFIDINSLEIPDGVSLWVAALGIISFFAPGLPWWERILGMFAASLPLFIIFLISKGGAMGMGDIKLMSAAGLILGYKLSLFALFSAAVFGSIIGVILIASKKKGRKEAIPFVPMLSLGILFSLFFGNAIISWYISLFY